MRPGALRWLRQQISERPSERTPYTASGEANDNGQHFAGLSLDIWEGGLFVATSTPIPVGTRLMVCFELPDGTPVEASGVVRWVHTNAANGERPGIGIALTGEGSSPSVMLFGEGRDLRGRPRGFERGRS